MKNITLSLLTLGYFPFVCGMQGPILPRSQSLPNLLIQASVLPVIPPAPAMPKQVAIPKHGPVPQPQQSFFERNKIAIVSGIGAGALIAATYLWRAAKKAGEVRGDG